MYADKETAAMRTAIEETDRRRAIQVAYNEEHGITPETIQKGISDMSDFLGDRVEGAAPGAAHSARREEDMSAEEMHRTIVELEEEMLAAADDLRFEYAAKLRDEIKSLRRELVEAEASAEAADFSFCGRSRRVVLHYGLGGAPPGGYVFARGDRPRVRGGGRERRHLRLHGQPGAPEPG